MEENKKGIIILGLGPGDPALISQSAWQIILDTSEIYLRTKHHPAVAGLPEHLVINSFDHFYEDEDNFPQVYHRITEAIIELGRRSQGVVYAVPGSPFIAEATSVEIYQRALDFGIDVRVVEGISFIESTLTVLGKDPFPQLSIVDALELASQHIPGFPPDHPALIGQIYSQQVASEVKLTLMEIYPDEHLVHLVHNAGTGNAVVEDVPLYQIDHSSAIGMLTSLYVPPMEPGTSFESFQEIIAHLRAPDGCPWDREQTHLTLRANLLEETYETLHALDREDPKAMQEEFGDLLLQILLHAQIASEFGDFTMVSVIKGIYDKIIRRHPHVFNNIEVDNVDQVLSNWEKFKAEERDIDSPNVSSLFDGVAKNLPALAQAEQYQERVARTGFVWEDVHSVPDLIALELEKIKNLESKKEIEKSFGELLFAISSLGRQYDIDVEGALRTANELFRSRMTQLEESLQEKGKQLGDLSQNEIKTLWELVRNILP